MRGEHGTGPGCTADAGPMAAPFPPPAIAPIAAPTPAPTPIFLASLPLVVLGLPEELGGGQPDASSVGKRQRIQRDGYRRDLFHFAARIGFDDDALDVGALLRNHPIIVDDRLGERSRESFSRLIRLRRE